MLNVAPRRLGRRHLLQSLAGGAVLLGSGLKGTPALADCIHGNARFLGPTDQWRVFQNAIPLVDSGPAVASAYHYWPVTDAFSWDQGASGVLNRSHWSGQCWLYLWANRASGRNPKPNPIQSPRPSLAGIECRVEFSSVERANAATQCQLRAWLGMPDWAEPWTSLPGTSIDDFVRYADLYRNPAAYFTKPVTAHGVDFQVMSDRPWLLSMADGSPFTRATMMAGRVDHSPGVVLDYEVADHRGSAATTAFFDALHADLAAANAKLFVYTDPLDKLAASGLDATNLPSIVADRCDFISVMLRGRDPRTNVAKSYDNQLAVLAGPERDQPVPWDKLVLLYDLGTTTLADAQFAYERLTGPAGASPQAVCFWRDGAVQGGACLANGTSNSGGVPPNLLTIAVLQGSAAAGTRVAATIPN